MVTQREKGQAKALTVLDDQGRLRMMRTPVMELEGLITPTDLHYVVQHFGLPEPVRAEGWDNGVPATLTPEGEIAPYDVAPFNYDKAVPLEKGLHPDTILAWAQNGELLNHHHGAPLRLLVPGWSGNWSVKWLRRIEVLDNPGDCWYHYNFYYYGDSPDDPNKELITTLGVKSIVTYPRDDDSTLHRGLHVLRGYAWSGAGAITQVDVSVDGGGTWQPARIEEPRDRFMWVR